MKLIQAAMGNAIVLIVLFFTLFPIVAPWLLWAFKTVLVALN